MRAWKSLIGFGGYFEPVVGAAAGSGGSCAGFPAGLPVLPANYCRILSKL